MSIELGTRLILTRNPAVAAIVNNPPAVGVTPDPGMARIYFGLAGQNDMRPRIVLSLSNVQHEHTFTGHAGYVTGSIEAACLAPDYLVSKQLAAAVITALDGYEGPVSGVAGLNIQYLTVDSENDIPVVVPEGKPAPDTRGVSVTFNFMILR